MSDKIVTKATDAVIEGASTVVDKGAKVTPVIVETLSESLEFVGDVATKSTLTKRWGFAIAGAVILAGIAGTAAYMVSRRTNATVDEVEVTVEDENK